jgi:glycosyltransferase involved in cell wall biosynthesis
VLDGVDTAEFKPLSFDERSAVRDRYGIPPDAILALYVGVLADYQGIDLLLESLGPILVGRPDLRVLLAGYPEEAYRSRVLELGLADRVLFPGKVPFEDTRSLTAAADIGLTPKLSASEGNLKIYNYLACGLPVVAFDSAVNREILGDLGVYVSHGDGAEFAAALGRLADDHSRREELGRRGRERAETVLSWDRAAERLLEIYRGLLNGSPGR